MDKRVAARMTVLVVGRGAGASRVRTAPPGAAPRPRPDFFCNRQQHNYFVLLFVSFCTKKKKKKEKKGSASQGPVFLCRAGAGGGPRAPGPPARALCLGGVNKVPFNKSASAWLLTHPPCPGRWDGAGVGRGGVRCRGSRGTLLEHLLCSRLWGRRREHSQVRPSPLRGPHAPSLSGPRPSDAPAEAAHRTWRPPARQTDPQTATAACFRSPGSRDALALPPCPGLRAPRAPRALASAPPWWLLPSGGRPAPARSQPPGCEPGDQQIPRARQGCPQKPRLSHGPACP